MTKEDKYAAAFDAAYTEYCSVPFRPLVDRLTAEYFYRKGAVEAQQEGLGLLRQMRQTARADDVEGVAI